jgi:hypothetical protein
MNQLHIIRLSIFACIFLRQHRMLRKVLYFSDINAAEHNRPEWKPWKWYQVNYR